MQGDSRLRQNRPSTPAVDPLALGPLLIARRAAGRGAAGQAVRSPEPRGEFVALYLPTPGKPGRKADIRIVDERAVTAVTTAFNGDGVMLLAPYRYLAEALPGDRLSSLPRSAVTETLQRYLDGLLDMERDRLCHRGGDLAAEAIRSLLTAAFLPHAGKRGLEGHASVGHGLGGRRRVSLIDRATAHIEANLDTPLSVEHLCAALQCSRSALYRAAAEAGGVVELILERRMLAVRDRLREPGEPQPIAQIAWACGFRDITQFNRRFKARFGAPPSEVRRNAKDRTAPSRAHARHAAKSRP